MRGCRWRLLCHLLPISQDTTPPVPRRRLHWWPTTRQTWHALGYHSHNNHCLLADMLKSLYISLVNVRRHIVSSNTALPAPNSCQREPISVANPLALPIQQPNSCSVVVFPLPNVCPTQTKPKELTAASRSFASQPTHVGQMMSCQKGKEAAVNPGHSKPRQSQLYVYTSRKRPMPVRRCWAL